MELSLFTQDVFWMSFQRCLNVMDGRWTLKERCVLNSYGCEIHLHILSTPFAYLILDSLINYSRSFHYCIDIIPWTGTRTHPKRIKWSKVSKCFQSALSFCFFLLRHECLKDVFSTLRRMSQRRLWNIFSTSWMS